MRFTMTAEGVERLATESERPVILNKNKVCREFSGPSIREGLLGGFPKWMTDWAKKSLKVQRTQDFDLTESRLLYYVLSMRKADHEALPIAHFNQLALTDFEIVKHVVPSVDRDGDCDECQMHVDSAVHLDPEPSSPPVDEVPPTNGSPDQRTDGTPVS